MNSWIITGVTGGESWLTFTEQVILFTWFLKSSFGEHSYVTQYLYILCPVRKPYLHTSSSVSLLPNFPMLFLLNPWPSSQIISSSLWIDVESFVWPFIILGKIDNYVICSKSCPQKEFPFTMFQSGVAVLHLSTFWWFPHIMKNSL